MTPMNSPIVKVNPEPPVAAPVAPDLAPPPPVIGKPLDTSLTPAPTPSKLDPPMPMSPALPPAPPPIPMPPKLDLPPASTAPSVPPPMPVSPPVIPNGPALMPPAVPAPAVTTKSAPTGQYKLYLRMGGTGSPRFEIRDGDQLLLKVSCEQIELHGANDGATALPGLTATGKVKVHGSGLDGTCDQLNIVSAKGEVALKGNVHLNCYRGTSASQVAADSVMFQLSRTGEAAAKTRPAGSGVVPASLTGPR
jgi:hypothetical protein